MIYLTSGLPGSGKTLLTVTRVKERAEKENRPVFYLGIAGVSLPWTELKEFKGWLDCPQNALIIIDECQQYLPALARGKGVAVPPEVAGFSTHRHRGVDVYLISQDPMQFDHFVRRLIGVHWHCVRPFGMTYCTVWQFEAVQGFKPNEAAAGFYDKISSKSRFDYPSESFALYKSAEVHTHKRRLPWLKLGGVLAILLAISVAGVVAFRSVQGFKDGAGASASKVLDGAKGSGAAGTFGGLLPPTGGKAVPLTAREYILARVPRIEGLPESAPVYDELAKVTAFPRLAGCVQTRVSCSCVTQQGSPIGNVPEFICAQFVKSGSFDPYRVAQVGNQPSQNDPGGVISGGVGGRVLPSQPSRPQVAPAPSPAVPPAPVNPLPAKPSVVVAGTS